MNDFKCGISRGSSDCNSSDNIYYSPRIFAVGIRPDTVCCLLIVFNKSSIAITIVVGVFCSASDSTRSDARGKTQTSAASQDERHNQHTSCNT